MSYLLKKAIWQIISPQSITGVTLRYSCKIDLKWKPFSLQSLRSYASYYHEIASLKIQNAGELISFLNQYIFNSSIDKTYAICCTATFKNIY